MVSGDVACPVPVAGMIFDAITAQRGLRPTATPPLRADRRKSSESRGKDGARRAGHHEREADQRPERPVDARGPTHEEPSDDEGGFSLHADTWLHENDVTGLERLCNYGARGPLSLERLSALPDGRLAYRMKRLSPAGQTHLLLSPDCSLVRGRPGMPGAGRAN